MNLTLRIPGRFRRLVARRGGRPARRRAAVVALLALPVAFAAVHFAFVLVAARSPLVYDPLYADKEARLAALERANPGRPLVVALGSSRTLNGLNARLSSEATGAAVYNFGVPGASSVTQAVYLRRLLAAGHRPDVLLLEVMPPLTTDHPHFPLEALTLTADRLTPAETELVIERYDFPERWMRPGRVRADYWPWSVHRFKLLDRVDAGAIPGPSRVNYGRLADAHGWLPPLASRADPAGFDGAARMYGQFLRDWNMSPAAARALRDSLALGREHRIATAVVLMPESSAFRALLPPSAAVRLNAAVAGLCAEFGVPLVDAREWLNDDQFGDGHHQLEAGAKRFTERLTTEAIRPLLGEGGAR